jgi:hypothetical protein
MAALRFRRSQYQKVIDTIKENNNREYFAFAYFIVSHVFIYKSLESF